MSRTPHGGVEERGRALRGEIHHPPWPLRPARAEFALNEMAQPLGVDLSAEPLLHYSARQDTLIWALAPACHNPRQTTAPHGRSRLV